MGRVCLNRGLPVAAVRFFREGFVAEPGLLDGANALDAVTAAVWAAFGRGEDALRLPDAERERHRHQAYDWLRAEFRLWQGRANGATEKGQAAIRQAMTQRLLNVDLALLRDEKELAKLPETEQANWRKLWSEIEALRKQVQSKR